MQCTSDSDLEDLESRLYSQVFHSTEDWESDPIAPPNMTLADTSNRQVSNYAIHNVSVPNAARYWCSSAPTRLPAARPRDKEYYKTLEAIRKDANVNQQLAKLQEKIDKRGDKRPSRKMEKRMNKLKARKLAQMKRLGARRDVSGNRDDKCAESNNTASDLPESRVEATVDSSDETAKFADDSIIYQRIDVASQINILSAEEMKAEELPVTQPDVSPVGMPVADNHSEIIVLSDSDSDSVLEVPLPVVPVYTIYTSNDSDSSACSIQDQPMPTAPASATKNEASVLGSCEHGTSDRCDGKNVPVKAPEKKSRDKSEANGIVRNSDNCETIEETMPETKKPKNSAHTKTAADIAEEERNEFLHTPDSNTNDFIANDVDHINKGAHFFNFQLHGSDLDLSTKDPEKLNRVAVVPATDIYETESSCSEAGTILSKGPVFQEVDFESPTKEIFCEPDLASFSKFITPKRKNKPTKRKGSGNASPAFTQVKTKALSVIEKICQKPTKDGESKDDDGDEAHEIPCDDSDEYNSDSMTLHVKKKSKKKKKKSKKSRDKLNLEADNESEVQESLNYVGENSKKSVTSNKDEKCADEEVEKRSKVANENKFEENNDKHRSKKHLQDKQMRMQTEDMVKDDSIKNKSKKQKKARDNDNVNREDRAETKEKQEELDKTGTDENISNIDIRENIKMESNSAESDELKQFSFVGAWNKLNTEAPSEYPAGIALGLNPNANTEQHKSSIFNLNPGIAQIEPIISYFHKRTEQDESTVFSSNENAEQYKSPFLNVIQNTAQNELVEVQLNASMEQKDQNKLSRLNWNKNIIVIIGSDSNFNENTVEEKSSDTILNHDKPTNFNLIQINTQEKAPSPCMTKNTVREISSGSSVHESTDQVKLSESSVHESTDQVKLSGTGVNKSFELREYLSLNANENTEPNDGFPKKPQVMETDNDAVPTSSDTPQNLKTSIATVEQTVLSDGPSTSKGSNTADRTSDVIVLSSDSDSDEESSAKVNFYEDVCPDYSQKIVLNTSASPETDIPNRKTSNPRSCNVVVNPFSAEKMKQSFRDFWTPDMKQFYDESWGQENYDIQQVWSAMPADKAKWKIVPEDQRPARSPRRRGPVCMRCREPGHPQYRCPRYSGPMKCSTCGNAGHSHTRCPNLMCTSCGNKGGYHTTSCYRCAHYGRIKCTVCNMIGHLNTACPDLWRRYHLTTQDTQPVRASQLSLKPVNERWCANCARRGHFQDACSYLKFEHFPTNSKIMSYDPMYNCDINLEPESQNPIPVLITTSLSEIRNHKHTVMADNNKKYENILKALKRQCLRSNHQFLDQIARLEKCIKNSPISKKNIDNIYKIRSLIHKHSRDS